MIIEIVTFEIPDADRERALSLYRQTGKRWLTNTDLLQKYYFFDAARSVGGGVYFWRSLDAVMRWHDENYKQSIRSLYGTEPRIEIFDAVMHVDPGLGTVSDLQ